MATYLLNWNPNRWDWLDLEENIAELAELGWLESRWSCGVTKRIQPGDRFYLMRLGQAPKGIIGSGWIISAPFEAPHWDDSFAELGRYARFVDIMFDSLLNADSEQILELDVLNNDPVLNQMNWLSQASGVRVPEHVAEELQNKWSNFLSISMPLDFLDSSDTPIYLEGAVRELRLTLFERNATARRKCLEHYGHSCVICGFDFGAVYGQIAEGFIHVHHLIPLSEIGMEYEVDAVKDLRPVCPNCHAFIHRRKPAFSIQEVQQLVEQNRK